MTEEQVTQDLLRLHTWPLEQRDANWRRMTRELQTTLKAKEQNKPIIYIDEDGCEVTILPSGKVFYNATEWY